VNRTRLYPFVYSLNWWRGLSCLQAEHVLVGGCGGVTVISGSPVEILRLRHARECARWIPHSSRGHSATGLQRSRVLGAEPTLPSQ